MNQQTAERFYDLLTHKGFKGGIDLSISCTKGGKEPLWAVAVTALSPPAKRKLLEAVAQLRTHSYEIKDGTYIFHMASFVREEAA